MVSAFRQYMQCNMQQKQPSQYYIISKQLLPDASNLASGVDTDVREAEEYVTLLHEALQKRGTHLSNHDDWIL